MVINPIVGVYIPFSKDSLLKVGGLPSPRTNELIDPGSCDFFRVYVYPSIPFFFGAAPNLGSQWENSVTVTSVFARTQCIRVEI